ncbi:hypothetical protein FRB97_002516 [Tulasnella sp. 331]|nr:hypothetical protein FRB97_002516 [Tulasnella sp. 331]
MRRLLRPKPPQTACFYCLVTLDTPPADAKNFVCPQSMHQEDLNHASYAVRASPSKNSFPLLSSTNPFCHTCRTNQTLQMNLLSNYLPASNDPMYQQLLDNMDAYKSSLDVRYPPICSNCLPAVEKDIQKKDQMARSTALGGWLRHTKQRSALPERARTVSSEIRTDAYPQRRATTASAPWWKMLIWRTQGILWISIVLASVLVSVSDCGFLSLSWDISRLLRVASIVPMPWDPTISRMENAQQRGRQMEFRNRWAWTNHQRIQWAIRVGSLFVTNPNARLLLLAVKVALPIVSLWTINIVQRPQESRPFRSSQVKPHTTSIDPSLGTEDAVFSTLSLDPHPLSKSRPLSLSEDAGVNTMWRSSSLPLPTPTAAPVATTGSFSQQRPAPPQQRVIFGQTSGLASPSQQFGMSSYSNPEDQMEWDHTPSRRGYQDQGGDQPYLRTQQFFPREQPTGLEGVWDSALRLDDLEKPRLEGARASGNGGGVMGWLGWSKT